MVRIRLKRMGRRNRPFYRINAVEKRNQRDGRVIENLGWYDPESRDEAKQVALKEERIRFWLGQGAQPSDTVNDILARASIIDAEAWHAVRRKRNQKKYEASLKAKAEAAAKAKADTTTKAEPSAAPSDEAPAEGATES